MTFWCGRSQFFWKVKRFQVIDNQEEKYDYTQHYAVNINVSKSPFTTVLGMDANTEYIEEERRKLS